MNEGQLERGRTTRFATQWRVPLVVLLAVLGVSDYLVLNVLIWPSCVEERAQSQGTGLTPSYRREEIVANVQQTNPVGVESDVNAPLLEAVRDAADVVTNAVVEPVQEEAGFSEVPEAPPDLSGTIAMPEIEDLLFASKSTALSRRAMQTLDEVVEFMLADREVRLIVRGHADDRGNEPANQRLSERRASETARYLRMQGISLNRIDNEGVGERHPADRSGSLAARARNRRVEVYWQRRGTP